MELPVPKVLWNVRIVFSCPEHEEHPWRVLFEQFSTLAEAESFILFNSPGCVSCTLNYIEIYYLVKE